MIKNALMKFAAKKAVKMVALGLSSAIVGYAVSEVKSRLNSKKILEGYLDEVKKRDEEIESLKKETQSLNKKVSELKKVQSQDKKSTGKQPETDNDPEKKKEK